MLLGVPCINFFTTIAYKESNETDQNKSTWILGSSLMLNQICHMGYLMGLKIFKIDEGEIANTISVQLSFSNGRKLRT